MVNLLSERFPTSVELVTEKITGYERLLTPLRKVY